MYTHVYVDKQPWLFVLSIIQTFLAGPSYSSLDSRGRTIYKCTCTNLVRSEQLCWRQMIRFWWLSLSSNNRCWKGMGRASVHLLLTSTTFHYTHHIQQKKQSMTTGQHSRLSRATYVPLGILGGMTRLFLSCGLRGRRTGGLDDMINSSSSSSIPHTSMGCRW